MTFNPWSLITRKHLIFSNINRMPDSSSLLLFYSEWKFVAVTIKIRISLKSFICDSISLLIFFSWQLCIKYWWETATKILKIPFHQLISWVDFLCKLSVTFACNSFNIWFYVMWFRWFKHKRHLIWTGTNERKKTSEKWKNTFNIKTVKYVINWKKNENLKKKMGIAQSASNSI